MTSSPDQAGDHATRCLARGVLLTRPAQASADLASRLGAAGWQAVPAPLLVVDHRPVQVSGPVAATLLTSANAVPAVPDALRAMPVLAVGNATAARARAAGCRTVLSADGDAAALAALTRRHVAPPGPLLLLSGQRQGLSLAVALRQDGYVVRRLVAYAARPVAAFPAAASDALLGGRLRAALFLSAETARTFARLLPPALQAALGTVDALAIGAPAASVLRPLPWRRVVVSGAPTLEGVLSLL